MPRKPTKTQLAQQELVQQTIQTTLAAGAKTLKDKYYFGDKETGMWILDTSALLAKHIGTDKAKAEIEAARKVLEGDE